MRTARGHTAGRLLLALVWLFHGLTTAEAQAPQIDLWAVGGVQYGGMTGEPQLQSLVGLPTTNRFEPAPGGFFEWGVITPSGLAWTFFGTDFIQTKNFVGRHEAKVYFYTPYYTDVRWYIASGAAVSPFVGGGVAWRRMHFAGTRGANNQLVVNGVFGARFRLNSAGFAIHAAGKPYLVRKNDLGQDRGWEVQVGVGRIW